MINEDDRYLTSKQCVLNEKIQHCLEYSNAWQSVHGVRVKISYKELLLFSLQLPYMIADYPDED